MNAKYRKPNGSECTLGSKRIFGNCIITKDLKTVFDQSASVKLLVKLKVEITNEIQQIYFSSPKVAAIFFTIKFYDNILSSTDSILLKHPIPSTLDIIIHMTQLNLKIV